MLQCKLGTSGLALLPLHQVLKVPIQSGKLETFPRFSCAQLVLGCEAEWIHFGTGRQELLPCHTQRNSDFCLTKPSRKVEHAGYSAFFQYYQTLINPLSNRHWLYAFLAHFILADFIKSKIFSISFTQKTFY